MSRADRRGGRDRPWQGSGHRGPALAFLAWSVPASKGRSGKHKHRRRNVKLIPNNRQRDLFFPLEQKKKKIVSVLGLESMLDASVVFAVIFQGLQK